MFLNMENQLSCIFKISSAQWKFYENLFILCFFYF